MSWRWTKENKNNTKNNNQLYQLQTETTKYLYLCLLAKYGQHSRNKTLIHFNHWINFADKPKASKETDSPCNKRKKKVSRMKYPTSSTLLTWKKKEQENHDEGVSKVKEGGCGILNF